MSSKSVLFFCAAIFVFSATVVNLRTGFPRTYFTMSGSPLVSRHGRLNVTEQWSFGSGESADSGSEAKTESEPWLSGDTESESVWSVESESEERRSSSAQPGVDLIYPGAKVSYLESLVLLQHFSLVHCLTKRAFEDLLRLVAHFLPTSAKDVLPSVYTMKRAFVGFPSRSGKEDCLLL